MDIPDSSTYPLQNNIADPQKATLSAVFECANIGRPDYKHS